MWLGPEDLDQLEASGPSGAYIARESRDWLEIWQRDFRGLRMPYIYNLRTDPYEFARITSNTYWDWCISRAYIMLQMQGLVAHQVEAFTKFPPRQSPASFNLDGVMSQLSESSPAT